MGVTLQQNIIYYKIIIVHVSSMLLYQQVLIHNPADAETRKKWDDGYNILKEANKREDYSISWLFVKSSIATSQTEDQQSAQATEAPETRQSDTVPAPKTRSDVRAAISPGQAGPQSFTSAAVEWPWTTGLTATSEQIMIYRPSGRDHTYVVETEPKEKPIYVFKTGQEISLLELSRYLKLQNIKRLSDLEIKKR